MRRLPVLEWVPAYDWKENLVPDAVSGMMLAVQQVTQGTVSTAESPVWNRGPAELLWSSFIPRLVYYYPKTFFKTNTCLPFQC